MAHIPLVQHATLCIAALLVATTAYGGGQYGGYRGPHDQYGHHRHETNYRYHSHGDGPRYAHPGHYPLVGHARHAARSLVLVDVRDGRAPVALDGDLQFDLVRSKERIPGAAAGPMGTSGMRLPDPHRDYVRAETSSIIVVHRRDRALPTVPAGPSSGHEAYTKRRVGSHVMIVRRGVSDDALFAQTKGS